MALDRQESGRSGRRPSIRKGQWDRLLAHYRERPAAFSEAAEAAEVSVEVATRAWRTGWPGVYPPIVDVLGEEQKEARARQTRESEELIRLQRLTALRAERTRDEQARADAVEARAQEGQIAKFARANSLLAYNASTRLLDAMSVLADEVRGELVSQSKLGGGKGLDPEKFIKLFQRLSVVNRANAEVAEAAMTLERQYLGKPIAVIGLAAGAPKDRAEALAEVDALLEVLEEARAEPSVSPVVPRTLAGLPAGPGEPGEP